MEWTPSGGDAPRAIVVRSSAVPPSGLSGFLRRVAYRIPDHEPRHWLLLMLADRLDVAETTLRRPLFWLAGLSSRKGSLNAWRRLRTA
jgi:hypothetical protein